MSELNLGISTDESSIEQKISLTCFNEYGTPEINYYKDNINGVEISLGDEEQSLSVEFKNGINLNLDTDELDKTIGEIAEILDTNIDIDKRAEPWNNQYVLRE